MISIKAVDLCKVYNPGKENEVKALDGVSFSCEEGEFVVVLGASGAGKSTLLNILGGMDKASSGQYLVYSSDVTSFSDKQLQLFRREDVGFVFQFYNLMADLTAYENVLLSASVAKDPLDSSSILERVGLSKRANNFPGELSGGEQQRVAIARALVKNPRLILADEPTGALDSKTGGQILSLLKDVASSLRKTAIIVTHNAKIALCADHLIRLSDGRIAEESHNDHPLDPKDVDW